MIGQHTDSTGSLATHFTAILGRLCRAVGIYLAAQARGPYRVMIGATLYEATTAPAARPALPDETWILLTHRLARLAQRFRALFARYQAGTPPAQHPSRAGLRRQRTPDGRTPEPRLPTARGWIGARIPDAAPCAGTIEYLLHNEPQMREFVSTTPQAGRLLRPLARMLGVTVPDWLRLPPRVRKPPAPRPATPAPTPAATGTGTPDRPLPPEIRAAARAWKKYGL